MSKQIEKIKEELKTIEAWAEAKKTAAWVFAVAKATTPGWGHGREVSEATFDERVHAAQHLQMRAP